GQFAPVHHLHMARVELEKLRGEDDWNVVGDFRRKGDYGHEAPWVRFVTGHNPDYPERILDVTYSQIRQRMARIARDDGDPASWDVHHWQDLNPAVLEGLEVPGGLEELDVSAPMTSVWDGVFSEPQAIRGQEVYEGACGFCHGRRLNGAPDDPDMRSTPPLARARFLRIWDGRSLATLFEYTRATMPENNPNSLTEQEYVDVIAYMLTVGGMPAGGDELQLDPRSLARVVIGSRP
ncbi:MAG: cytochrome c, partial [Gemmatimonadetes bacterium]|nr:cytochrome c [Gemmatimonadota bacterium]